eukprot:GHVQ01013099.1.p1 GENE.GHVQ01013099.1~~GHVQ01013099.1.p1  ORF type:complete len:696 (+),score=76.94 GHVQ01013099.1:392-2479(+)
MSARWATSPISASLNCILGLCSANATSILSFLEHFKRINYTCPYRSSLKSIMALLCHRLHAVAVFPFSVCFVASWINDCLLQCVLVPYNKFTRRKPLKPFRESSQRSAPRAHRSCVSSCLLASHCVMLLFLCTFFLCLCQIHLGAEDLSAPHSFPHVSWASAELVLETLPRRTLTSTTVQQYDAFLFGGIQELGYYFIDVQVGTPPQRQSVILDTGSSLLGFPCKSCSKCGDHIDMKFDVHASSTASWLSCTSPKCFEFSCGVKNKCPYYERFTEGSEMRGSFVQDYISVGEAYQNNPRIMYDYIGCHAVETKHFVTQEAAGIIGIAFPRHPKQPTLIDALFDTVSSRLFSICLAENGGQLTIGGWDRSNHLPNSNGQKEICWTPLIGKKTYIVALTSLKVGDNVIASRGRDFGDVVVDSGTTYTYFPRRIYRSLRKVFDELCTTENNCQYSNDNRQCWSIADPASFPSFLPIIKLTFSDVDLDWRPASYLYFRGETFWCTAIDEEEYYTNTVLGMSFFKHKEIVFHREEHKIGFIEANCPSHSSKHRPTEPEDTEQEIPSVTILAPEDLGLAGKDVPVTLGISPVVMWSAFAIGCGLVLSAMVVIISQTVSRQPPMSYQRIDGQRRLSDGGEEVQLTKAKQGEMSVDKHARSPVTGVSVERRDVSSVSSSLSSSSSRSSLYSSYNEAESTYSDS